jgi:hypothetical protein
MHSKYARLDLMQDLSFRGVSHTPGSKCRPQYIDGKEIVIWMRPKSCSMLETITSLYHMKRFTDDSILAPA